MFSMQVDASGSEAEEESSNFNIMRSCEQVWNRSTLTIFLAIAYYVTVLTIHCTC